MAVAHREIEDLMSTSNAVIRVRRFFEKNPNKEYSPAALQEEFKMDSEELANAVWWLIDRGVLFITWERALKLNPSSGT